MKIPCSSSQNITPVINVPNLNQTPQAIALPFPKVSTNAPTPCDNAGICYKDKVNVPNEIQAPLRRSVRAKKPVIRYGFDD